MGTGSTRKRNISRYEQYRQSGGNAVETVPYVRYGYEPGYTAASGRGQLTTVPARITETPISPEERLRIADARQQAVIDANARRQYYEDLDKYRGPSQMANAEWARRQAERQKRNKPPTLEEQFNALYGGADETDAIRASYGAQRDAINRQYDQLLGRLGTEHAAAEKGVRAEGQRLQTALTSIGADATAQLVQSNRQIDKDYATALRGLNGDYKALAGDVKGQGAGGAGLKAEAAAGRADLREGHVADAALGQRYQQLLSQAINDRQATGATVTVAGVNDLARVLQESRDNASEDRLAAVAKIEANMAGDLAAAKSEKAKARYSFFLDVLKSGGTLGQAALKVASPGTVNSAIKTIQDGNIDYSQSFSGLSKSKNEDEVKLGQSYEEALLNGSKTPQQVWAEWQANPDRQDYPLLSEAIMQMVGYSQALKVDPDTLKKYLKDRGYK